MKKYGVAYNDVNSRAYVAIQVWAQAAERARTLQLDAMISTLRHERFDTVIGRIGFDAKGDLIGIEPFVFYVWKAGENRPTDAVKTTTQ
jgi:branched-chain amino acid transport system substrate-binding protein